MNQVMLDGFMKWRPAVVKTQFTGRLASTRRRGILFVAMLAFAGLSAMPLMAINAIWLLEAPATGNWSTASNWTPGVPTAADTAYLGMSLSGMGAINAIVEVTTTGAVANSIQVGAAVNRSGTLIMSAGSLTVGGSVLVCTGNGSTGIVNQTGGTLTVASTLPSGSLQVGTVNNRTGPQQMYTISGGTLIARSLLVASLGTNSTAQFIQSGGTLSVSNSLKLGGTATSLGIYQLTGGTTLLANACTVVIGNSLGVGEFDIGDTNGTGSITGGTGGSLTVSNATSKLQGWGTIAMAGTLTNSQRIIADGYGTDRSLDLASFTNVVAANNTTTNGWYAQNNGKLLLPNIAVSGNGTNNWGVNNGTNMMVNGVKLVFGGVTTNGTVSGSLLARERADVSVYNAGPIVGIWNFTSGGGLTFGTARFIFRYDLLSVAQFGLAEANLKVWHSDGSPWARLAGTVNTNSHTITTTTPVSTLGWFAITDDHSPASPVTTFTTF